ncbi:MAG TPA: polysaccharide deacetylase family protein [Mycobacteriales bacterium]|nr:polysaccharide deacetylase family protein [Mycobacteriales bacterium]
MQRRAILATTVAAVVGLGVGFGAGYAAHSPAPARTAAEAAPQLAGGGQALPIAPSRRVSPRIAWDGTVSAWSSLPPQGREIYVGIDDGTVRNPEDFQLLRRHSWPVSFFIPKVQLDEGIPFWKTAVTTGGLLEDHSVDHPALAGRSLEFQTGEICGQADEAKLQLGRRPVLFRPPYGSYDQTTLEAAKACGMRAVVMWDATVNDGVIRTQHGGPLEPGDIVLMHFRTTFAEDFGAVMQQVQQQGLTVGSLEKRFASNRLLNAGPPSPPPGNGSLNEETGALPTPAYVAPTSAYVPPTPRRSASASPSPRRSPSHSASRSASPTPSTHGLPSIVITHTSEPPSEPPPSSSSPPSPTESPSP